MLSNRVGASGSGAAVEAERAPRIDRFVEGPIAAGNQRTGLYKVTDRSDGDIVSYLAELLEAVARADPPRGGKVVTGAAECREPEISRILGDTGDADDIGDVQFDPVCSPEELVFEETVPA